MNLQKYCSLKIHQDNLAAPIYQTFCLLWGVHRDLLFHVPPHKRKTVQTTTFIWVYFLQLTHQLLTMKPTPKYFNQVKKLWRWNDTSLPIIYFITYSCSGFGRILISKFIYIIFHIFYHSLFACLANILQRDITIHCTTNMLCLDFGQRLKEDPTPPCWWSKFKTSWSTYAVISSKTTTADFWRVTCSLRIKG